MTEQGPRFGIGLIVLLIVVAPIFLLDSQPWKTIAIVNAVVHVLGGLSFTMVETRFSRSFKALGQLAYGITCWIGPALLVAAIFVD